MNEHGFLDIIKASDLRENDTVMIALTDRNPRPYSSMTVTDVQTDAVYLKRPYVVSSGSDRFEVKTEELWFQKRSNVGFILLDRRV